MIRRYEALAFRILSSFLLCGEVHRRPPRPALSAGAFAPLVPRPPADQHSPPESRASRQPAARSGPCGVGAREQDRGIARRRPAPAERPVFHRENGPETSGANPSLVCQPSGGGSRSAGPGRNPAQDPLAFDPLAPGTRSGTRSGISRRGNRADPSPPKEGWQRGLLRLCGSLPLRMVRTVVE